VKQLSKILICLALSVSVAACSAASAESASVVNANCPMSGDPVKEGSAAEFNGETIGFCCNDCISDWDGKSDEEKTAALAGS
jgi:hypothetical protein